MIYFIRCHQYVKIGYTKHSLKRRVEDLQIGNPFKLEALAMIDGDVRHERIIHDRFSRLHIRGEWYRLTDEVKAFIGDAATRSIEEIDRENRKRWADEAGKLLCEPAL